MRAGWRTGALGLVLVVSGCAQPEDRINAALPVAQDILAAHERLIESAQALKLEPDRLRDEYDQRLKRRALECGHGYSPGAFTGQSAIVEALGDTACFADKDRALLQWLGVRRVSLLLAAPPLRPLASRMSALAANAPIRHVEIAAGAGIALVGTASGYQVFDLAAGKAVHAGDNGDAMTLSPNGRLFVTGSDADTQVRSAETGEVLATLPDVSPTQFHWMGDAGLLYASSLPRAQRRYPVAFLDPASGRETAVPMGASQVERLVTMPKAPRRHVLVSHARLSEIELRREASGWTAVLLSERALSAAGFANRATPLTADGRTLVGMQRTLQLLTLPALEQRSVPLTPFRLDAVVATPDPDVVLVAGRFPDALGRRERYLYSLGKQSLARVDDAKLPSQRVVYLPPLRRNAVIDGHRIVPIDRIPAAAPVAAEEMLNGRQAMAFAMEREKTSASPYAISLIAQSRAAALGECKDDGKAAPCASGHAPAPARAESP